jgi:hypothetical protein
VLAGRIMALSQSLQRGHNRRKPSGRGALIRRQDGDSANRRMATALRSSVHRLSHQRVRYRGRHWYDVHGPAPVVLLFCPHWRIPAVVKRSGIPRAGAVRERVRSCV